MAERSGHHSVALLSRVQPADSIHARVLAATVQSSDTRIRFHAITRLCAVAPQGAVLTTAPLLVVAAAPRGGVRQHGGH
ncbi:hypothetical protein C5C18_03310 [Rathayibacter tritici]|uniref:Uncharacterized protein n=1 Tax=Rathayibacter tritici TaxID=33888 RepID=A0A160KQR0_9MICO|nr:hypothetical protein [Rathayibacter tritici]AND15910.1 hypothetical protein A6122_0757 [Rathayibacter tritici]PPF26560.1 hypothetical protein C5C06_11295 [Rathayibacter tritici]PPF70840.1 hypothetical protein C5C21_00860 [Rathayibacter tritici]PPG08848.1 hypothetical protein C5C18_03310 [Rathayibacter tritici]PPI15549.1 hypothetical protein C5D07_07255 [Rathayibacter tritici]